VIRHVPRAQVQGAEPLLTAARAEQADAARAGDAHDTKRAALARALTLLLSEELRLAPEQIEHVLARELARVRRARTLVVRLHPDDLALVQIGDHYTRGLELAGKLTFLADATLTRGGCVLSSNLGEIDATLETRLTLVLTLLERGTLA
jgi:flagellar biosynthesis/type III secretory pathway protein FliH